MVSNAGSQAPEPGGGWAGLSRANVRLYIDYSDQGGST
jgi:hypothetical protein